MEEEVTGEVMEEVETVDQVTETIVGQDKEMDLVDK